MTILEMVLAELGDRELRVPEVWKALRARAGLRWWQRLYLWNPGGLYVDLVRWEDAGLVESVRFWDLRLGIRLTRWRLSPAARNRS